MDMKKISWTNEEVLEKSPDVQKEEEEEQSLKLAQRQPLYEVLATSFS